MTGHERSVLVVSPYFPPSTLAGVHRARLLAKHLPAAGWKPTILCVHESCHEEPLDHHLAELTPSSVEIIKVGALPAALTRRFGVGDMGLRSWFSLRRTLRDLIERRHFDAALITGAPYYPMLSAGLLSARGIPVTLDFQDPWVSTWGASQPALSKAGVSHRLATLLEPRALAAASYVTSVSDRQNAEMAARYDWLDASRMAGIPIGGDPDDFESLRRREIALPERAPSGRVNLSFVGAFMPRSGPLMRLVLMSLAALRRDEPEVGCRISMNFVGTSNQPDDYETMQVMPIAHEVGVADAVTETSQRVPYLQALSVLAHSDAILLIGSDEPHYTASKIYPALMSGRPFLSLFHSASSSHRILVAAGGGFVHPYVEGRAQTDAVAEIADSLRRLVLEPEAVGPIDAAAYEPYSAAAIARRFAALFEASAIR